MVLPIAQPHLHPHLHLRNAFTHPPRNTESYHFLLHHSGIRGSSSLSGNAIAIL
jgi:hypothetical protein